MTSVPEPAAAGWMGLRHGLATVSGFVRHVVGRFIADGCLTAAAALSYTTLVSLVPLIAIGFAVLSAFPIFLDMRDQILSDLLGRLVPEVGAELDYWFRYFAGTAVQTTTVGVLALAVTVVLMLATIEDQLQIIWHVHDRRPWLQRILAYWAMLTLGPLLLGTAFSLPSYVDLAARHTGLDAGAILAAPEAHRLLALVPFVLESIAFTLVFVLIPHCAVRWREALAGGVVASFLLDALKLGFAIYVGRLASYRVVYGAIAVIPIFLLWIYIVWLAVLFGAVVAAALPRWRAGSGDGVVDASVARQGLALALIAALGAQARHGGALAGTALAARLGVAPAAAEDALAALARAGIVVNAAAGGWVLARAPESLSLRDFQRALGLAGERRPRPIATARR